MSRTATHLGRGRYRVGPLLARGGYGRVYKGIQVDLEREVALKILDVPDGEDPLAARRFVEEARLTAQLVHPNIVTILELGEEGGVPWIAYELLPGQSLKDVLEKEGRLSWPGAREVMLQVAAALEAAHDKGIVHRDIKSENVLLAGKDLYKVADFGIAKWLGQERVRTAAGMLVGTPAYMAPEVIQSRESKPASDFYALGILLHEMLVGELPMDTSHLPRVLRWHLEGEIPRPTVHDPDLPARVDLVIAGLLEKDPERRVKRVADLRDLCQDAAALSRESRKHARVPRQDTPRAAGRTGRTVSRRVSRIAAVSMLALVMVALVLVIADVAGRRRAPADVASPAERPAPSPPPAATPVPRLKILLEAEGGLSIPLELVRIPGGAMRMGEQDRADTNPDTRATPVHPVTVSDFYLGPYELTREQYARVMGDPPPAPADARRPAFVQFTEAERFLAGLRRRTNLPFRMPSEAEWEYACRAGATTDFYYGDDPQQFSRYGWAASKDVKVTRGPQPVGRFKANKFGLFDMMGNCTEWVADDWHPDYTGAPTDGRAWLGGEKPDRHISRGGSTNNVAENCRCARRTTPLTNTLLDFVDHTMRVALDGSVRLSSPPVSEAR